jgi:hypothetical protein
LAASPLSSVIELNVLVSEAIVRFGTFTDASVELPDDDGLLEQAATTRPAVRAREIVAVRLVTYFKKTTSDQQGIIMGRARDVTAGPSRHPAGLTRYGPRN